MNKIYLNLIVLMLCMAALSACKHSSNGTNTTANTSRFTTLYNAPANSQPGSIQDGDAGQISLTAEPNPVTHIP